MEYVKLAREIGKEIQKSEAYVTVETMRVKCDEDKVLQDAIGEFNLKRMAINNEAQKEDRNEETLEKLNNELREAYTLIMQNENMSAYNNSKKELDDMVQRATAIISMCAEGEDPETCDYDPAACGGDCSGCSGCH